MKFLGRRLAESHAGPLGSGQVAFAIEDAAVSSIQHALYDLRDAAALHAEEAYKRRVLGDQLLTSSMAHQRAADDTVRLASIVEGFMVDQGYIEVEGDDESV